MDKGRPVIIYCRSGNRSASAAELLKSNGFNTVYDLGSMRNYFHC
ncbi:MAG: rhodanese-like domain-containing protein [Gammaproteobacteria bacterium]|nr:rhodanese-like domain-containing protein [Gammaproteobacteria bacterium]